MIDKAYALKLAETVIDKYIKDDIKHEFDVRSTYHAQKEGVCGRIIRVMWDNLMSNYKGWEKGRDFLLPEKAMACLLRRGLPQEAIRINQPSATIQLKNLEYIITKQGAAFTAYPRVFVGLYGPLPPMRWVTLSGDEFAEFLFDFDEIAAEICTIIDNKVFQRKVRSMQYRILCETVDRLGEQYLAPAGIAWHVGENFTDDKVTLIFRAHGQRRRTEKNLLVDATIDGLAEVIPLIPDRMAKGNK